MQFFDWLGHPLLYNDRCLGLTVQKTVDVPQLQFSDKVADMPVVVLKTLLKPVETPQVQFLDRW